eukprot:gb/GFBE01002640.1/.p1 GENE.gb/GFBE01002640.1/~~gb/GFBE01002640.1/.p1  ORF type:complete len:755 (+),score=139.73 gb/GFBE01002640.1/:1-2265(+)
MKRRVSVANIIGNKPRKASVADLVTRAKTESSEGGDGSPRRRSSEADVSKSTSLPVGKTASVVDLVRKTRKTTTETMRSSGPAKNVDVFKSRVAYSKARTSMVLCRQELDQLQAGTDDGGVIEEESDGDSPKKTPSMRSSLFAMSAKALGSGANTVEKDRRKKTENLANMFIAAKSKDDIISSLQDIELDESMEDTLDTIFQGLIELKIRDYAAIMENLRRIFELGEAISQDLPDLREVLKKLMENEPRKNMMLAHELRQLEAEQAEIIEEKIMKPAQDLWAEVAYQKRFSSQFQKSITAKGKTGLPGAGQEDKEKPEEAEPEEVSAPQPASPDVPQSPEQSPGLAEPSPPSEPRRPQQQGDPKSLRNYARRVLNVGGVFGWHSMQRAEGRRKSPHSDGEGSHRPASGKSADEATFPARQRSGSMDTSASASTLPQELSGMFESSVSDVGLKEEESEGSASHESKEAQDSADMDYDFVPSRDESGLGEDDQDDAFHAPEDVFDSEEQRQVNVKEKKLQIGPAEDVQINGKKHFEHTTRTSKRQARTVVALRKFPTVFWKGAGEDVKSPRRPTDRIGGMMRPYAPPMTAPAEIRRERFPTHLAKPIPVHECPSAAIRRAIKAAGDRVDVEEVCKRRAHLADPGSVPRTLQKEVGPTRVPLLGLVPVVGPQQLTAPKPPSRQSAPRFLPVVAHLAAPEHELDYAASGGSSILGARKGGRPSTMFTRLVEIKDDIPRVSGLMRFHRGVCNALKPGRQ